MNALRTRMSPFARWLSSAPLPRWLLVALVVYLIAAIFVLPQWLVSVTAGNASSDARLNAITGTRGALIGLLTPLSVVFGGIAGLAAFQAFRERKLHAEVYGDFLLACRECKDAVTALYLADPKDVNYGSYARTNVEKRAAMDRATDRALLLGSESVQAQARALNDYCGTEMATRAGLTPKVHEEEWRRATETGYDPVVAAFLAAARTDL
jgi:hypothetical protein